VVTVAVATAAATGSVVLAGCPRDGAFTAA
jgi:hypothetical protein